MYGPFLAWCVFLFGASHHPGPVVSDDQDFSAHFVAYALLGGLWIRAVYFTTRWNRARLFLSAIVVRVGYGILDEVHQSFVANRHASLSDVVADSAGALAGAVFALLLYGGMQVFAARRGWPNPRRVPGGPA